jgi:succinate dehydrogenase/fumarate reductase-like Fe-S protein
MRQAMWRGRVPRRHSNRNEEDNYKRLRDVRGKGYITNCDNAQNCVRACPMSIPLTKAIYEENRETVIHGLFGWLKR